MQFRTFSPKKAKMGHFHLLPPDNNAARARARAHTGTRLNNRGFPSKERHLTLLIVHMRVELPHWPK